MRELAPLGRVAAVSSVYETAPIGNADAPAFLNGAVLLETELSAAELREQLRPIEARMGRVRTANPNAPRTMDLDLVLYNDARLSDGKWQVPDPHILERPFMAQALAEIAPDYVHPVVGLTLGQLARRGGEHAADQRIVPEVTERVRQLVGPVQNGDKSYAR